MATWHFLTTVYVSNLVNLEKTAVLILASKLDIIVIFVLWIGPELSASVMIHMIVTIIMNFHTSLTTHRSPRHVEE